MIAFKDDNEAIRPTRLIKIQACLPLIWVGILEWFGPSLKTYFITDPSVSKTLVFSATILLIIAGSIAGYLPAKRASEIKPIIALRDE